MKKFMSKKEAVTFWIAWLVLSSVVVCTWLISRGIIYPSSYVHYSLAVCVFVSGAVCVIILIKAMRRQRKEK